MWVPSAPLVGGGGDGSLWEDILAPARAADWTNAGATIINRTGTPFQTIAPYTGTAGTINTAITDCSNAGGGIVLLQAGTFSLSGAIVMKSNVTLRGEGMATIVSFTGSSGSGWYWGGGTCTFVFAGAYTSPSDAAPPISSVPAGTIKTWTGTHGNSGVYTRGSTIIDLGSTPTGLGVGDMLVLYQADEPDGNLPMSGYFVSDKTGAGSSAISWFSAYDDMGHAMEQRVIVTAINGTAVTIAPPLIHPTGAWKTALTPQAGWLTTSQLIRNAGVENLRLVTTSYASVHQAVIGVAWARDCWIKGVGIVPRFTSWHAGGAVDFGVSLRDCHFITMRDCWLDKMIGGGIDTTTSYGIALKEAHHCLIENNILNNVESPMELLVGATGCAVCYNYERYVGDESQEAGVQAHEVGATLNLVEGNRFFKVFSDLFHGNTLLHTFFRNYFDGRGMDLQSYHRWYNAVGNVIVASTAYQSLATDGTKYDRWESLGFRLGYPSQNASQGPQDGVAYDAVVWTSLLRWGNYTSGQGDHWVESEIPTSDPLFPNDVPASQSLPASFYRTSRPGFFTVSGIGTSPWPLIGPDVTGGSYQGGRVYKTPAQLVYESVGGAIASFDPTVYGDT
jgi:hypothetical protein